MECGTMGRGQHMVQSNTEVKLRSQDAEESEPGVMLRTH